MKPWRTYLTTLFLMLNDISLADAKNLRYLALGDSYTIGEGTQHNQCWPITLKNSLLNKGIEIQQTDIIAQTGWRTDELLQAIQQQRVESPYDIVSLMIGVNDQYHGVDVETFAKNAEELIRKAITLAGDQADRVLLVSIPDWSRSPYGESESLAMKGDTKQIDNFNAVLQEMAMKYQLAFANITEISRDVTRQDFVSDGLHPSQRQYQRWVENVMLAKINSVQDKQGGSCNLLP